MTTNLPAVSGKLQTNAPIGKATWFKVGGNAEFLFKPANEADLIEFLQQKPSSLDVNVLGAASNVIISDNGIKGVVIKLGKAFADTKHYSQTEHIIIEAGAAVLDYSIAQYCLQNELTGLEFLSGIPGSIGGNIPSNAGAYGAELSEYLIKVEAVNFEGEKLTLSIEDLELSYRNCGYLKKHPNTIFTKAFFKVKKGNKDEIKNIIDKIKEDRGLSQPVKARTGGSTFKNPAGHKAWQLIDKVGMRGAKIGDAQISEKHCNFLINNGNAKSGDLIALGKKAQALVKDKTGINLEWEIKLLGEN